MAVYILDAPLTSLPETGLEGCSSAGGHQLTGHRHSRSNPVEKALVEQGRSLLAKFDAWLMLLRS